MKQKKHSLYSFGGFLGELVLDRLVDNSKIANKKQEVMLSRLMEQNKDTEYGKKYHFADVHSYEDYKRLVPLSTYSDYEDACHRMAEGEKNLITAKHYRRFTHTTGTTGNAKLIPLSHYAEWICHIFSFCAPVGCAKRWFEAKGETLPATKGLLTVEVTETRLPCGATLSCLSAIPLLNLKPLVPIFSTSPKEILFPDPSVKMDMQYLKLLFALAYPDVGYLGTVFITTLESLFFYMEHNWQMLCDDIEKGSINESVEIPEDLRKKLNKKLRADPKRADELRREFEKGFDGEPIVPRIWKKCGWFYGMGTGARAMYAKKLRRYIGDEMPMHYMGYGATEAMMAVPTELDSYEYVLLPQNVFFEFRDIVENDDYDHLKTIDQLEVGKDYEVIITNMSGFYRYMIKDVVKCTGYYYEAPKVTFVSRLDQIADISGEKIMLSSFDEIMENTSNDLDQIFIGFSIYTDFSTSPGHFVILIETAADVPASEQGHYAEVFEKRLIEVNSEVEPNQRSGSLGKTEVKFLQHGTYDAYRDLLHSRGASINQLKPIKAIDTDEKKEFFFARLLENN